ncbi:MAG: D-glycerate dehydrogenase [Candidatus Baltobacteraceae bacterium]
MNKPKVFVCRQIPQAGLVRLAEAYDVEVNREDVPLAAAEIARRAEGALALVTLLADKVDAALLDACPSVRIVANVAVGYDNIVVPAATVRNVWVTNTPDVLSETTADLAWALILGAARRIGESERYLRAGRFTGWTMLTLLGADVHHKTLGIVGFGRIGQAVARRARGFAMRVLYTGRARASEEAERETGAAYVDKATLLRESDFVSLHAPLTPATRHLIGASEMRTMKRTAFLINTSRGPLVDEAALAQALREGTLAGAGLDVFEAEPQVHPALLACENALIVPHIGSATVETRERMATLAAENCLDYANGRRPRSPVNELARRNLR